ncbi:MAG TPA: hypothetical protein VG847_04840 [Chitinophagaceae bacterium]|nr:hypothetical protein [Chitinophagaceae bacterium]
MLNCYLDLHYFKFADPRVFNQLGLDEFHLLLQNPKEYLLNIFQSNHHNSYGGFLEDSNSFWNDTRSNVIVKMLSLFDIFSQGNLFINSLFYNFLVFFGCIGLYRTFIKIFPDSKLILIACIFLLPSTLYYSSSIHRDGLIYLSLGMAIYHLAALMNDKTSKFKHVSVAVFFLLLILLLRNFVFIALVPALLAWLASEKVPRYSLLIFLCIYLLSALVFFSTSLLPYQLNLPAHVASRQSDFIIIAGNGASAIPIHHLTPTFIGFLRNLPEAIEFSLMRPFITEHGTLLYIPAATELLMYQLLLVIFIFFRKKKITIPPVIYFGLFFSITMFLMIGYTIPIIGAISRYRSIYFPFILIPIAVFADWKKFGKFIHII